MTALERWEQVTREHAAWRAANPVPVVETPILDTFARVRVVLAELAALGVPNGTTLAELADLAATLEQV